ncbi:MAG: aminoacyl-histidine dipeptidase [Bacteroidetes bacterium]|nr:aminoacyl-histidine dipeptidase [Bacteroidota bacterium]
MSKDVIAGLEPKIMWEKFYDLSQIPRPSKKEEKIREFTRNFAKERNLKFKEDEVGNIVILVPATPGYENAPTVIIQGHLDMVCEKNKGTVHDFDNDPIKFIKDGDWIKADGTTLGADNGIGVAAGMAVADDASVIHGPLELLCTVDEETGLTGVNNLQPGFVEGKVMLNLDSEEDGAFYVGCSGGQDTVGYFNIEKADATSGFTAYELLIGGLKGGHSGLDVNTGKANAIKFLGRLLRKLEGLQYEIAEMNAGSKRNAIPREAEVVILFDTKNEEAVRTIINSFVNDVRAEYKSTDGNAEVELKKNDSSFDKVFAPVFTKKIVSLILTAPHGVVEMNHDIEGLVETSTNLATVNTEGEKLRIGTSQRSSIESAKRAVSGAVQAAFELAGAVSVEIGDGYPGWTPNMDSELLKTCKVVFKGQYGKEPHIKAIHAGLECGILGDKYPGMDMISFGPTIQGAHSPDEKVNIADVEKFYTLVKGVLLEYANRK